MTGRRADALIVVAAVACGAAAWAAVAYGPAPDGAVVRSAADVLLAWACVGAGVATRRAGASGALGWVLVGTGFAWLVPMLRLASSEAVATAGWVGAPLPLVGMVMLLLAFPAGKIPAGIHRVVAVAAAAAGTVGQVLWVALLPAFPGCTGCDAPPRNLLLVHADAPAADLVGVAQNTVGAAAAVAAVVLLVRRVRAAGSVVRRRVVPVWWAGVALCAVGAVALVNEGVGAPLGEAPWVALTAATAAIPLAMAWGVVRRRLDHAGVASLVEELGTGGPHADLEAALARTLGDASLRVRYWRPQAGTYVAADGSPAELPADGATGRSVTHVRQGGVPVAALVHDPSLDDDAALMRSVCAAAALALENERLQADLRAQAVELRASRARVVAAGDRERRRLERDLHDGAQQRLVSVAMTLGLAAARGGDPDGLLGDAQRQVEAVLAELRELSHGLLPPLLRERGVDAALAELAKRAPVPTTLRSGPHDALPPDAEVALYFVASEALANAAKHGGPCTVRMELHAQGGAVMLRVVDDGTGGADPAAGSGLRGLQDRLGALGGTLRVGPGQPRGTVVEAVVPCG